MRNALETRPRDGRLLFHSDQGVQYKSHKYRRLLWRYGGMQSMSRRGNYLDNSPMERVFHSLKSEWLPKGGYGDFSHAVRDRNQWINGYYNVYRLTRTTMVYRLAYMKKSGNRLSRCPDFVIHYNTQSLALKHTYEVYFGYERTFRKYGRFRQKLPVKTDIRKNSARRRPVTGRSPRTGEEAQCICSYREQVRPEALS